MTTHFRRLCALAAVSAAALALSPGHAAASDFFSDVAGEVKKAVENPNVKATGNNISDVDTSRADQGGNVKEGAVKRANAVLDPRLQGEHMVGGANVGLQSGETGIKNFVMRISYDTKNALITLAGILLLFAVYRLIFSKADEDEAKKLKETVVWATIGIVVMQSSFVFVKTLYGKDFDVQTAKDFMDGVFKPMTRLLQVLASFAFVAVGFYGFYKIVAARGDEGEVTRGKTVFINAVLGFMALKIVPYFIYSLYGQEKCETVLGIFKDCKLERDVGQTVGLIAQILNWTNGFVAIATVLIIIYAGFLVLTSGGDEDKIKQAKGTIKYVAIGLVLLAATYILFRFFVTQDA